MTVNEEENLKRVVAVIEYVSIMQRDGVTGSSPNIPLHIREGAVAQAAAKRYRATVIHVCM